MRRAPRWLAAALLCLSACSEPAPAPDASVEDLSVEPNQAAADLVPAPDLAADLLTKPYPRTLWLSFANNDVMNLVLIDDPNPPSF